MQTNLNRGKDEDCKDIARTGTGTAEEKAIIYQ
jgi:hypothetical protein